MRIEIIRIPTVLAMLLLASLVSGQTNEEFKKEKFRIKIVEDKDGEMATIDTSFNSKEEMMDFMESRGLGHHEIPNPDTERHEHGSEENIDVEEHHKVIKKRMKLSEDDIQLLEEGDVEEVLNNLKIEELLEEHKWIGEPNDSTKKVKSHYW